MSCSTTNVRISDSNSATSSGVVALDQPEVEERDVPAGPEQVVARVRVAVERVQPVEAAEHEAEDRLGREVALVLRPALDLGEARARRRARW